MTPLEHRVDFAFVQALRCMEYRTPTDARLRQPAFTLALGLRYGLLGAAATHHLLLTTQACEIEAVKKATKDWEVLVSTHVRLHLIQRPPEGRASVDSERVGRFSNETFRAYFGRYHQECELALCLDAAARSVAARHHSEICGGWRWFQRFRARSVFGTSTAESIRYALLFFDRRKADLEEVPEIALLGE